MKGFIAVIRQARYRRLLYLLVLAVIAFVDIHGAEFKRWTFEFYALDTGKSRVEERIFRRSGSQELDIRHYIEETLLGPVSPESAPLFPREAALRTLLLRDGTVYADLSEPAAWALPEGGEPLKNLATLRQGIRRNFSFVRDVRIFIEGNEVDAQKISKTFKGR